MDFNNLLVGCAVLFFSCAFCASFDFVFNEEDKVAAIQGINFLKLQVQHCKALGMSSPMTVTRHLNFVGGSYSEYIKTLDEEELKDALEFYFAKYDDNIAVFDEAIAAIESGAIEPDAYDMPFILHAVSVQFHREAVNSASKSQADLYKAVKVAETKLATILKYTGDAASGTVDRDSIVGSAQLEVASLIHRKDLVSELYTRLLDNPLSYPEVLVLSVLEPAAAPQPIPSKLKNSPQLQKFKQYLNQPAQLSESERRIIIDLANRVRNEFMAILMRLESFSDTDRLIEYLNHLDTVSLRKANIGMPEPLKSIYLVRPQVLTPNRALYEKELLVKLLTNYLKDIDSMLSTARGPIALGVVLGPSPDFLRNFFSRQADDSGFTVRNVRIVRNYAKVFNFF